MGPVHIYMPLGLRESIIFICPIHLWCSKSPLILDAQYIKGVERVHYLFAQFVRGVERVYYFYMPYISKVWKESITFIGTLYLSVERVHYLSMPNTSKVWKESVTFICFYSPVLDRFMTMIL